MMTAECDSVVPDSDSDFSLDIPVYESICSRLVTQNEGNSFAKNTSQPSSQRVQAETNDDDETSEYSRTVGSSLWKHQKHCPFKSSSEANADSRHCQGNGSLLLPFSSEASEGLKQDILSVMYQDEVTAAVRTDDLIMKFGTRLHFKHGHLQHRRQYIRECIRQIGPLFVNVSSTLKSVSVLQTVLFQNILSRL